MFTGLIQETGIIKEISKNPGRAFVVIQSKAISEEAQNGDSICINGICLTVSEKKKNSLLFNVSPETVDRTTFSLWKNNIHVNLEQALTLSSHIGGHFVQGHVDCTSEVLDITKNGGFRSLRISLPASIFSFIVEKGPIAVDGISLTVAACNDESFEIAVIPETVERSNIKSFKKGTKVNLEADLLAKYIEKIMNKENAEARKSNFYSPENLNKIGFI